MSGTALEITVNDADIQAVMVQLLNRTNNLQPAMAQIGEIVIESVHRNFEEHVAPDGTPWQPVSESYAKWKQKKGRNPADINIFNNILQNSIHRDTTNDSVTIGTNVIYAAIRQFGPPIARPFLGVRDDDWPTILSVLQNYLMRVS
jgi:phage virion morphogenesis protein